jgi:hypothetical protein
MCSIFNLNIFALDMAGNGSLMLLALQQLEEDS